ncbi:YagU family protein [Haemophilus parahaemolyticus]|jgi:inner membrane protein|uniref:YagU family protein n=2 Tax=Haemophilus parahaemolyticus TaxID=735 RepID=UPI0027F75738|nr:DUF1440 domain-containing protein [Haemophilus parahaemolyticus]MDQ6573245.1 DUF1440 domain-containing protein [Haemophilus parahaemolyticus]
MSLFSEPSRRRYGVAVFVGIIAGIISAFVKWGAEHPFNSIGVTHMIFSLVFAIGYCVVAEIFPKIKFWQGIGAGIIANICVHYITFPALGLTPPVAEWPLYEHISELVGHIFWFWSIEVIRRDLRNRITHQPDVDEVSRNS